MTTPTDPQAAIDRLRAMVPHLKCGHVTSGLIHNYNADQEAEYLQASQAFAADIETLANLTQVGWGICYTDAKGRAVELQELRLDGSPPGKLDHWFPVYARVPA